MNIAIIPARGGSKRIPRKNIKMFSGLPIIAHSINTAIDSGLFERVIVTTDDEQIAAIAREYGAEVPFIRPAHLSDDHTNTASVISHTLNWCRNNNITPKYACCIYATAPFVKAEFLHAGLNKMITTSCSTAFSVTSFAFPIYRGLKINADGSTGMLWPENELVRSQDLPEAYHDAGQFYWVNCNQFNHQARLYNEDSRPIIIPRKYVHDIDTQEDWELAQAMHQALGLDTANEKITRVNES